VSLKFRHSILVVPNLVLLVGGVLFNGCGIGMNIF
jgi:hypothetical protein